MENQQKIEEKIEEKKEELTIKKEEYENLQEKAKKVDEYYDKYLRLAADFENFRKRVNKERIELIEYAHEDLIFSLLPVIDNFERAYQSIKQSQDYPKIIKGIEIVLKELHFILKDKGVSEIKSLGEKFDPSKHEAIMQIESNEHPEDIVIEEIQKGYTLGKKVIRPSKVLVSKKIDKLAKEEKNG